MLNEDAEKDAAYEVILADNPGASGDTSQGSSAHRVRGDSAPSVADSERCEVGIYMGRRVRCGRFPKGRLANGAPACGLHLRQEKRWGLDRIVMAETWTEREES